MWKAEHAAGAESLGTGQDHLGNRTEKEGTWGLSVSVWSVEDIRQIQ